MSSSTVSAKYQVVIPKELRQQLNIKAGQKVYLTSNKSGEITIKTHSQVAKLYGSVADGWGKDSTQYMRTLRDEANRDRT